MATPNIVHGVRVEIYVVVIRGDRRTGLIPQSKAAYLHDNPRLSVTNRPVGCKANQELPSSCESYLGGLLMIVAEQIAEENRCDKWDSISFPLPF